MEQIDDLTNTLNVIQCVYIQLTPHAKMVFLKEINDIILEASGGLK